MEESRSSLLNLSPSLLQPVVVSCDSVPRRVNSEDGILVSETDLQKVRDFFFKKVLIIFPSFGNDFNIFSI